MNKSVQRVFRREAHIEPSPIVTKSEVERLQALRAKPTPHQVLRPKYIDHAQIDNQMDKINERRLTHQKTRLMVADYQLNRDRLKAVNKGRAKASFNQKSKDHSHSR
ncbi:MAG: hypothetical protein COA43_04875 [Robiginitomaculum sp.]|nr:MAG: hypothetical protein COA43_04875 [Robiginitomaculum sp.]